MTSVIMSSLMRGSPSGNILVNHLASSQALTYRAKIGYDHETFRKKKYRGAARERRKQAKRDKMAAVSGLKDAGLDVPPFFLPQRYKLLFQVMQDHKNCNRLGRKPMPQDVKESFGKALKEYNEFKVAEKTLLDREKSKQINVQLKAMDAILFMPDYMLEEALSDTGEQASEEMKEFMPGYIYLEQILHMFPPEQTCRMRILPAF